MPEVHLRESWRKYPSWYQTSRRITPTLDRRGRDWDGHFTSSLAADAEVSTSERTERIESGGEEVEMQQKYFNVASDDLWCI